jgi:uncharacterized alpha-E superfamily protein
VTSGLLSRIAETMYWTGRYVERADDTARIVDVYVHRMLEGPGGGSGGDFRSLLAILGIQAPDAAPADISLTLFRLAYDTANPSSIAGAVLAARSGGRSVREVVSSEMWECLNVLGQSLPAQRRAADRLGPHVYFRFIRERAALFFGLADSTMSRDAAWRFLVLGRSLERADMTARLLLAWLSAAHDELDWSIMLHACGAHESFIRTHGWASGAHAVPEFLLLDRLFPRSVLHSLSTVEECLQAVDSGGQERAGTGDPARRPIGQLRTRLEYADPWLLPGQLPELLGDLQLACAQASEAISERFFQDSGPVAWVQGG